MACGYTSAWPELVWPIFAFIIVIIVLITLSGQQSEWTGSRMLCCPPKDGNTALLFLHFLEMLLATAECKVIFFNTLYVAKSLETEHL